MALAKLWFPHDLDASQSPELSRVIMRHGATGYGLYWRLVETIFSFEGRFYEKDIDVLAYNMKADTEMLKDIITGFGLFEIIEGVVCAEWITERLKGIEDGSIKGKESAAKGHAIRKAKAAKQQEDETDTETADESFEQLWKLYDKKIGKKEKLQKKWSKIKAEDKKLIMEYIPKYIQSQPDRQYRKNLETFLNNNGWLDEIIGSKQPATNGVKPPAEQAKVPEFDGTPLTREKFRPQRRDESYQSWLEKNNRFFEAQDRYNETLKKGN